MSTPSEYRLRTALRVARAARDLSQEQLAESVGVSRQTISSIETGQYCPSTALSLRLALVLGEQFEHLFWLEGEPGETASRA
ncbi:MAG TPA: helix-turn-helix transcriptional regulator [Candidatus Limnocylindrales bacterium]|jgi:putative transcriptional regulator|nr:helix-turn-helix transcriptional regulator [Candidatus Limnocylindrales bacterium]